MYRCYVDGSGLFIGRKIPGTNNIQCLHIKTEEEGSKSLGIKYGPSGNVPLEVFDGVVALNAYKCESLSSNKEDCSTCHYLNQSRGYECQWCQSTGCVNKDNAQCRQAETCGKPVVTKISPTDGPPKGGTVVIIEGFNFGVQSIVTVTVAGVPCNIVTFMDRKIKCTTSNKLFGSMEKSEESGQVVVTVDGMNSSDDIQFTYKVPKITGIYPTQGILSGGRTIHLSGNNLNIGNMEYAVVFTNVESSKLQVPVGCTIIRNLSLEGNITCVSKGADDPGMYKLKVTFDTNTEVDNSLQFEYLPDPTIISTEPAELKSINRNRESERRRKKRATRSNIVFYLDGFSYIFTSSVLYVDDPLFSAFYNNVTYSFDPSVEDSIELAGGNLATVTTVRDYQVLVGSAEGSILSLTETELVFRPPSKEPPPRVNEEELFIRVKVGNLGQTVGIIEYPTRLNSTIIIIFVLSVLIIFVVLGIVLIHRRNQARKTRMIVNITKEMHDLN